MDDPDEIPNWARRLLGMEVTSPSSPDDCISGGDDEPHPKRRHGDWSGGSDDEPQPKRRKEVHGSDDEPKERGGVMQNPPSTIPLLK